MYKARPQAAPLFCQAPRRFWSVPAAQGPARKFFAHSTEDTLRQLPGSEAVRLHRLAARPKSFDHSTV